MSSSKTTVSGRRSGKSRMNEMIREKFAEMGMQPCPRCAVPGKWDIFHTPEKPCPKLIYECCNDACPWRGTRDETVHPKHEPDRLLCPECHEVVEPA